MWFSSLCLGCFFWGTARATQRPLSCPCATCRESNTFRSYLWVFRRCSSTSASIASPDAVCLPARRWTMKARCSSVWMTATRASRTWSSWWTFTSWTAACCPANSNTTAPGSPCEPGATADPSPDKHSLCICALNNTTPRPDWNHCLPVLKSNKTNATKIDDICLRSELNHDLFLCESNCTSFLIVFYLRTFRYISHRTVGFSIWVSQEVSLCFTEREITRGGPALHNYLIWN